MKIGVVALFFSLFFVSVTLGKGPTHPSVNTFGMGGPYEYPTWPYYDAVSNAWRNTHVDFQYWGAAGTSPPSYALFYNRGQSVGEYYNTWTDNENEARHLDLKQWFTDHSARPESCLIHWHTNTWEHPTSVAEWFFVPGWDNANDADHNWIRDKEADYDYNNALYGTRFSVQRSSYPYYIEDAGGGLSGVSWTANKWKRDYVKLGWGTNADTVSYRADSSTASRIYLPSAPPSHTYNWYFVDDSSAANHNAVAMADSQARVIQCFWTSDLRQIVFNIAHPLVQSWNGHNARKFLKDRGSYRPQHIHSDNPGLSIDILLSYLDWTYGGTSPTCWNEPEIDTGWRNGNILCHKAIADTFNLHPNDSSFLMVSFSGNYGDTSLVQYGKGGMEENMITVDGSFEKNEDPEHGYFSHPHQIRWYQSHNKYILMHAQGWVVGSPLTQEESKIYSLATYYLYKDDLTYFLYGTGSAYGVNFGDTTVWWYGLMGVDMGAPTDTCKIVQSPSYPIGNLWRRPFQNGIVLARHKPDGSTDYTSTSSYSLGGYYYRLNSNGAIVGDSINSISLHNNEGAILTKRVPGTALLPPIPLSPQDGSIVDTPQPTLIIQNVQDSAGRPVLYYFEVDATPQFGSQNKKESTPFELEAGQDSTTHWTVPTPLSSGVYYWRSRAYTNTYPSETGMFSTVYNFQVPGTSFRTAANNEIHVFPNPFKPSSGQDFVTFRNIPLSSKITITTLSGELVRELSGNTSTDVVWDAKNSEGKDLASGVYYYRVDFQSGSSTGKLAVIR